MVNIERHIAIRKALAARGITLAAIAVSLECSAPSVTLVSQGRTRSARIESAIALALDTTPAALWPDRYPVADEPWRNAA